MNDHVVVFVNFHSEALIEPRARELVDSGHDVIVADNSGTYSGPGEVVVTGGNIGFGAACNAGAAVRPSAPVIVLHNPDVDSTPDTVDDAVRELRAQRAPGVLAPIVRLDRRELHLGWSYPSPRREALLLARDLLGVLDGGRKGTPIPTSADLSRRFGSAAFLAIDGEAFRNVGGFDDRYFLYVEDLDLWHRIRASGRTVAFSRAVMVSHQMAGGAPASASARTLLRWAGVELFAQSTGESWQSYRRVHRVGLHRRRYREGPLGQTLGALWSAGTPPDDVQAAIRPLLESGRWVGKND